MEYRLNKDHLLNVLEEWNRFLKRKVHLIACGGTAMTLSGVKPSTKDVDFMVPNIQEHQYLIKQLRALEYAPVTGFGWKRAGEIFQFDIFHGNFIHTTELLTSPLEKDGNSPLKEYSHLYLGILNDYDLISSKLMRGTRVDFDDCLSLAEAHRANLDIDRLVGHFNELISFDVAEARLRPHMQHFLELLQKRGLYD